MKKITRGDADEVEKLQLLMCVIAEKARDTQEDEKNVQRSEVYLRYLFSRVEQRLKLRRAQDEIHRFGGSKGSFQEVNVVDPDDKRLQLGWHRDGWKRVVMTLQVLEDYIMRADFEVFASKGMFCTTPLLSDSLNTVKLVEMKLNPFTHGGRRIEMNGYELGSNVDTARIIQLRGLPKRTLTVEMFRNYLRATANFIREEKAQQFINGEIHLPDWCVPWPVRGISSIPVIAWCRNLRPDKRPLRPRSPRKVADEDL